jgi:Rps23 Pro-64 3,4-dihydroxylase Tpa1-like proline 4-hydroxylase
MCVLGSGSSVMQSVRDAADDETPLALGGDLDAGLIAQVLARHGRVHIPDVLSPESATALYRSVAEETPWRRTMNTGQERNATFPVDAYERQPKEWRAGVEKVVSANAANGFQYVFDTYNVAEEIEAGRRIGIASEAIYDFLNGAPFLALLRQVTGDQRVAYCDAQITRYSAGQFLTQHDDDLGGKDRLYAYVLGLTPQWKADWGGLLLFLDEDGHVAEGYTPKFNALNLFKVPAQHCVSAVSAFCPAPRYSITGWVRSKRPG